MKWEYKVESYYSYQRDNKLDELGKQGWELVSVVGDLHYFKREVYSKYQDTGPR